MEFVSWDDYPFPTEWKKHPVMFQTNYLKLPSSFLKSQGQSRDPGGLRQRGPRPKWDRGTVPPAPPLGHESDRRTVVHLMGFQPSKKGC
jgi:hypothetical protein